MTRECRFDEVKSMDFMRILSLSVVLLSFPLMAKAPKSVYPKIQDLRGSVQDLSMQPTRTLKKSDRLLEKFHAKINGPSSGLTLQLYEKLELEAFGDSEFLLPNISWETRQISDVQLLKGFIQIDSPTKDYANLKIKSPLFEVSVPAANFLLFFDPQLARAGLFVFKGEVQFGGLNAEETLQVKAGQKVYFQGVKEEDEISYDLLLQGRKVPKGKLGNIEKISADEIQKYSPELKQLKRQQQQLQIQKQKKDSDPQLKGLICRNPAAPLNYCVWQLNAENQCVRKRCTADGLWKDNQIVSDVSCTKKSIVKLCDY